MVLNRYNEKRDFGKTPEPSETAEKPRTAPEWRFVVQRHNASRLHYDLRLEINDTLKSWAVPKGPSMNPEDKRLAVMVEDHPVSYLDFEGIIPKGNYGAGTVEIWDSGTYEPQDGLNEQAVSEALEKGNLKYRLSGKKLKGGFDLVKIKNDDDKSWLLIKRKDDHAVTHPYSSEDHRSVSGSVRSGQDIRPMLARVRDEPFDHPDWLFEVKWDGYRTLAEV
ncbi:MAG: DNA polymerase ligase N-terminal domain-containing protein, partial [Balneolales bacterium]